MAALTAATSRKTRNRGAVRTARYVVGTSATIYQGALCSIDTATGRLVAGSAIAARKFAGMAVETVTGNTSGSTSCTVEYNVEALINAESSLTAAYAGANCIISTDDDVQTASSATALAQVLVGEVVQFEGGDAWVALRNYAEAAV